MRARSRAALGALFLLSSVIAFPTAAAAHLYLVRSEPGDAAQLGAVPREIRLTFSEPVELALTRVELLAPDGRRIRLAELEASADAPNVLLVRIEGLVEPGSHTVVWRATGTDGHPISGQFGFSVDEDAEGLVEAAEEYTTAFSSPHHDPATFPGGDGFTVGSPGYVVVRWLTFAGLLGVIGVVSFKLFVLGLIRRGRMQDGLALLGPATARSASMGLVFSLLLLVAALARLYAQSLALHGPGEPLAWTSVSTLLARTTWGWGWILQAGGAAVALAGFRVARQPDRREVSEALGSRAAARAVHGRSQRERMEAEDVGGDARVGTATVFAEDERGADSSAPRTLGGPGESGDGALNAGWLFAATGAFVLAFTPALAGHSAAVPDYTALAVLSDGLHVLGAGGWLGSLLAVLAVGIPVAMRLDKERRGRAVAVLVNAFSPTALGFAALLTATGVLNATFHIGSFSDLWQSDYGRTLLLKIGVLSLVFATGAYNWRRVRPALGDDEGTLRLRRFAGFELAVGAAVLLVTAVLVATPPPMDLGQMVETETGAPATGTMRAP